MAVHNYTGDWLAGLDGRRRHASYNRVTRLEHCSWGAPTCGSKADCAPINPTPSTDSLWRGNTPIFGFAAAGVLPVVAVLAFFAPRRPLQV